MRRKNTFIRKTRRGKIVTVVQEHYLRDDLYCGSEFCEECPHTVEQVKLQKSPQYLMLDANVLLHQMDLLEGAPNLFEDTIFLQTVLEEVRHRDYKIYKRVRAFLAKHASTNVFCNEHHRSTYIQRLPQETANDRNDRAIRVASRWYQQHLQEHKVKVLLLTNDAGNRAKAIKEGLNSQTLGDYVRSKAQLKPELLDLLAKTEVESEEKKESGWEYPAHITGEELKKGLLMGKIHKGTFKVDRDYWMEASVLVKDLEESVFIPGMMNMNRAVDMDIVGIELLPEKDWKKQSLRLAPTPEEEEKQEGDKHEKLRPTGRVVAILQRNWRPYCGSFEVTDKKQGTIYFHSINKKIPRIKVETKQLEKLMDQRILVAIDSWPRTSKYPRGHYVRTLGAIGERDTETQVVLMEHDIPNDPWSKAVLGCLPPQDYTIPEEEIKKRVDLRKINICSIDPPGCTDIDDTLHCIALENGNFEVGVHIADVSHFIKPDSALDVCAANRGTSVYLVDRRIDMIPTLLSTNLCSLRQNVDRLTFSVVWEMTPKAEIVNTKFFKSVINSVGAFTYNEAQVRLDSDQTDDITMSIKHLNALARELKQKRLDAGALQLASTQLKFLMNKEREPEDVAMYELKEVNSLVEEFMLLANVAVGKRILEHFPTMALLRRHPTPTEERFESLKNAAASAGFEIKTGSSKQLADTLDQANVKDYPFFNRLLRIVATRCMTQAVYFCTGDLKPQDFFHYGLASPVYTHFTSPIRRYADIVVHRLLATSLGIDPLPASVQDRTRMREMADCINHRNLMARMCSRASSEVFTLIFFRNRKIEEEALIIAVRSNGIRVFVPRYGLEGQIRLVTREEEESGKEVYKFDSKDMSLTHTSNGSNFKIFGKLRVIIYVQEAANRREWLVVELTEESKKGSQILTKLSEHQASIIGKKRLPDESPPNDVRDRAGVGTLESVNRDTHVKNKSKKRKP